EVHSLFSGLRVYRPGHGRIVRPATDQYPAVIPDQLADEPGIPGDGPTLGWPDRTGTDHKHWFAIPHSGFSQQRLRARACSRAVLYSQPLPTFLRFYAEGAHEAQNPLDLAPL